MGSYYKKHVDVDRVIELMGQKPSNGRRRGLVGIRELGEVEQPVSKPRKRQTKKEEKEQAVSDYIKKLKKEESKRQPKTTNSRDVKVTKHRSQGLTKEQKEGIQKIGNVAKKAAPFVIPVAMTWLTNKIINK